MKCYSKPIVTVDSDIAEGVYAASGAADSSEGGIKCDSIYMKGVWQAPDYSVWPASYKQKFGCQGCPAYRYNGCGLLTDYVDSGNASSYDTDNGNRKPSWEKKGYGPDDEVKDWNM